MAINLFDQFNRFGEKIGGVISAPFNISLVGTLQTTSPVPESSGIINSDIVDDDGNKAEDKATKREIFAQNSAPVSGYKEGDIWFDADDNNTIYRANSALEWVSVKDGTIAGKGTTFRQASIPTALAAGDLWFDSDDSDKCYVATAAGDDQIGGGEWIRVDVAANPTLIDVLNTTNAPAAAGADVTGDNTAADTALVNALAASKVAGWAHVSDDTKVDGGDLYNLSVIDAAIGTVAITKLLAGTITSKTMTFAITEGSGDSAILFGKTDFGQDSTNGIIIGYDDSDSNAFKFELTGGKIQTSGSGKRIVIDSSDNYIRIYDASDQIGALGGSTDGTGRYLDLVTPAATDTQIVRILAQGTTGTQIILYTISKGYQLNRFSNENTNSYRNTNSIPIIDLFEVGTGVGLKYTSSSSYDTLPFDITLAKSDSTNPIFKITQSAVTSTNFRKIFTEVNTGISLWISDGTTAEGALTGVEGDICLNGGTGAGQAAYCDAAGTNWTNM